MKRLPNDDEQSSADGDCFETAGDLAMHDPSLLLCHGLVQHPGIDDLVHWHAWCETTREHVVTAPDGSEHRVTLDVCIDRANGNDAELPTALYYRVGQITNVRKYTLAEASRQMVAHGHYGPWHEPVLPETESGDSNE